jgi:CrcB protein
VLGIVVFAGLDGDIALFVGTGACGSFTTYSSFSVQSVRMWETGDRLRGGIYALGTLGLCLAAAAIAAGLGTVLQL